MLWYLRLQIGVEELCVCIYSLVVLPNHLPQGSTRIKSSTAAQRAVLHLKKQKKDRGVSCLQRYPKRDAGNNRGSYCSISHGCTKSPAVVWRSLLAFEGWPTLQRLLCMKLQLAGSSLETWWMQTNCLCVERKVLVLVSGCSWAR